MKTLQKCTKKELIEYIQQIRPKADAYDRVCKQLGIENNILEYISTLGEPKRQRRKVCVIALDRNEFQKWRADSKYYGVMLISIEFGKFTYINGNIEETFWCVSNLCDMVGVRFDDVYETPRAKENPNYNAIIEIIKTQIR